MCVWVCVCVVVCLLAVPHVCVCLMGGVFRRWNQLDVGIVLLSVVGIILEEMKSGVIPINPTIIRVMRVLRIARGNYIELLQSGASIPMGQGGHVPPNIWTGGDMITNVPPPIFLE